MEKLFYLALAWAAWETVQQLIRAYIKAISFRDPSVLPHLFGTAILTIWFGYRLTDVLISLLQGGCCRE